LRNIAAVFKTLEPKPKPKPRKDIDVVLKDHHRPRPKDNIPASCNTVLLYR